MEKKCQEIQEIVKFPKEIQGIIKFHAEIHKIAKFHAKKVFLSILISCFWFKIQLTQSSSASSAVDIRWLTSKLFTD